MAGACGDPTSGDQDSRHVYGDKLEHALHLHYWPMLPVK